MAADRACDVRRHILHLGDKLRRPFARPGASAVAAASIASDCGVRALPVAARIQPTLIPPLRYFID
ncbi:hypothetical protein C0Z19_07950 [Trinickia soli]|uniref:Uncharacterized protein n=1 Tax=Trinickia soli TaxID=380675 RepID=A0A2N7W9S7_9BURK|nr:hypothetical protein C0Z19_07950 [Trinickia soli]